MKTHAVLGMALVMAAAAGAAAQEAARPWHAGALDESGTTADPASRPEYSARRAWPSAPAAAEAPTRPYPCRIVSYADKWTRHGLSNYMPWRWPNGPLAADRRDPMEIFRDTDVDGDGRADDDFVSSYPFSLEQPLGNPSWPMHMAFPEIINQRFYGGASWFLGNTEPGTHSVWIEQGYNPDHSPPWFDSRAEDHPLQGQANEKKADSVLRLYWSILWRKADFLNDGDRCRVTFDDRSRLAVIVARTYWLGYDDVRMIVQDGGDLWVSDTAGFDIPGLKGYMPERNGRVFVCHPTKTTWARYEPKGHRLDFDASRAAFAPHAFTDVQAVGWYLAKSRTDSGTQAHCKWYGFEADAVVNRPESGSVNLAMVDVPAAPGVPAFRIAACEWPYDLWRRVHRWGNVPFNTLQERYVYDTFGQMGSMALGEGRHGSDEPVTGVRFYDALAMCNTLSELEGKRPCYYLDAAFTQIFKNQFLWTRAKAQGERAEQASETGRTRFDPVYEPVVEPVVYVDWSADGHRLPTVAEWRAACGAAPSGAELAAAAWTGANAGGTTHPVGALKANARGLHDMIGNVEELVWAYGDAFDPARDTAQVALGGDFRLGGGPSDPPGSNPWNGSSGTGLRPVCRAPGLPKPAGGDVPAASGTAGGLPARVIRRGERAPGGAADAAAKPALDMVKLAGGTFPLAASESDTVEVFVGPFEIARTETTFAQWRRVKQWAEARGWSFSLDGDMGSMYWYRFPHAPDEPVTHVTGHDLMVWCNALSAMEGRTPCYYTDETMTQVYTNAFKERPIRMSGELAIDNKLRPAYTPSPYHDPFRFCRYDTDGYRLPTLAEWQFAATEGGTKKPPSSREEWTRAGWSIYDGGGRTHPVGLKEPNGLGLYDLWGNAAEWLWSKKPGSPARPVELDRRNPAYDPYWSWDYAGRGGHPRGDGLTVGGSFLQAGGGYGVGFHNYYPDLGFRAVRCEAGARVRDGREPLAEWPKCMRIDVKDFNPLQAE